MRYPMIGRQAVREISVPKLSGGLNLRDSLTGVRDNQLTDCVNVWFKNGMLKTRPPFITDSAKFSTLKQFDKQQEVFTRFHNNIKLFYDGFDCVCATNLRTFTNETEETVNSIDFEFQSAEKTFVMPSINDIKGEKINYFLVHFENYIYCYVSDFSIYKLEYNKSNTDSKETTSWQQINLDDCYIPTVMTHCKALNGEIGFSFVVGRTSEVLKYAGLPDKQIRFDATKLKKLLNEHNGMTIDVIRQIPSLLEAPMIVIDSKKGEQSKIVMGDLYDLNGKIVTVVLLLTPTSKKGTLLDVIKVSSAQGRSHVESLFKQEDGTEIAIRYVDEKRIQDWLNVNRLQLPLRSYNPDSNNIIHQISDESQENYAENKNTPLNNSEVKDSFVDTYNEKAYSAESKNTSLTDSEVNDKLNGKIFVGISDADRTKILKNKTILAPIYDGEASDVIIESEIDLKNEKLSVIKKALKRIGEQFNIFTDYSVKDVDMIVTLSRGNIKESVSKAVTDINTLAKLMPILKASIENAVGIETHDNRYFYDVHTLRVHELLGGYIEGECFVPVRFGIKELKDGTFKLYVVICQEKIATKVVKSASSDYSDSNPDSRLADLSIADDEVNVNGTDYNKKTTKVVKSAYSDYSDSYPDSRLVDLSIAKIAQKVKHKDLIRYLPDGLLNEDQRHTKYASIAETVIYTNEKNDREYNKLINNSDRFYIEAMLERAAAVAGYGIKAYRTIDNSFNTKTGTVAKDSNTSLGKGYYFVADKSAIDSPNIVKAYLKTDNPYIVYDTYFTQNELDKISDLAGVTATPKNVTDVLQQLGYDSVVAYNTDDTINQIVVFEPVQIKSGDLKTYDDNENVIPLSQRFDKSKNDIRYALIPNDDFINGLWGNENSSKSSQKFNVDLDTIKPQYRKTYQKAMQSGVLNDSDATHLFVEFVAKISADKGISFDFTNNERLKNSDFAVKGKDVGGYLTKDGITVNIESKQSLNSIVGHEITHVLEGTALYDELRKVVYEYAEIKGELKSANKKIADMYTDADIDSELTAYLVGKYLFEDTEFINRLSVEHRNLFERIYDEIKYFCKIATAGSREAMLLERAKHAFEKAYSAESKNTSLTGSEVKYSIKEIVGKTDKKYGKGVYLDSNILSGITDVERKQKVREFVKTNLSGNDFFAYDKDEIILISIAQKNEKFKNQKGKKIEVLKELYGKNIFNKVKQEAIVLADELIETSKYNSLLKSQYSHGWLDNYGQNFWEYRKVFIQEKNKTVWEATLNIATSQDGRKILYDIDPIKKIEDGSNYEKDTMEGPIKLGPDTIAVDSAVKTANYSTERIIPRSVLESQENHAENKNNSLDDSVIRYSLMNNEAFDANIREIVNMSDESALKEQSSGRYIRVLQNTPSVILENVSDAKDIEVIIRFDAAYLATRYDGVIKGHYHNYGEDFAQKLISVLNNPDAIIRLDNGRLNLLGRIKTEKGDQSIVSVELNTVKDINNKNTAYNLIVSMIPAKDNYIKNIINKRADCVEYAREDLPQVNPQLYEWLSTINDKSSNNILFDLDEKVNAENTSLNDGEVKYGILNDINIDKQTVENDNIDRANKQGELVNDFYYALEKSEWRSYYKDITDRGYLASEMGQKLSTVIGNKLILSQRIKTGKSSNDFQVFAVYRIENSIPYDLYELKDVIDRIFESGENYDSRRMERVLFQTLENNDGEQVLTSFDGNSLRFVDINKSRRTNDRYGAVGPEEMRYSNSQNDRNGEDGNASIGILDGNQYNARPNDTKQSNLKTDSKNEPVFSLQVKDKYSYENLINKPDMEIAELADVAPSELKRYRSDTYLFAKEMRDIATNEGNSKNTSTSTYLYCEDLDKDILITKNSYKHGASRFDGNYVAVCKVLPEILKNSIVVNELDVRSGNEGGYVLLGMAETNDSYSIVRMVVNKKSWQLNTYEELYAVKKKTSAKSLPNSAQMSNKGQMSSTISISEFLTLVNSQKIGSSVLSKDVIEHLGNERISDENITPSIKYSMPIDFNEQKVTVNMTEAERAEILSETDIKIVENEISDDLQIDFKELENSIKSQVEKSLVPVIKSLGILKNYNLKTVNLDFEFTAKGLRKSLHSQIEYGGNFSDFAKVMLNIDKLLDNSVLIETHTDKAVGTQRENARLKQVYVLISVLKDGNTLIPVEFEIKEYVDNDNRLYLAVAMTKIKETDVMGNTAVGTSQLRTSLISVPYISIKDLVKYVNTADKSFIKYLPNEFLTKEQINSKKDALLAEEKKYSTDTISYSISIDTTKSGRVLTNVEVDNLIKFGKALGVKIVVEDLRNITIADKIVSPDGYIDKDTGTIYISRYAKAPVTFVLKHELSHYCENNFEYAAFAKQVENSKLYKNWLSNKTGEKYLWDAEEAYKQQTLDSHPEIQKLTDPDIKNTRLQTEIIADFVGDLLFTDNGTGMAALIADTPKQYKSKIVQFINDFISYLKKKLSGNREITLRLSVLEDSFKRMLVDVTNSDNNVLYDGEVRYSFGITQDDVNNYVDNAYSKSNVLDYLKYAVPTERLILDVKSIIDISDYSHALRDNDIRHINNSHGVNTNEKYPVTSEDIKLIPYIIQNYDKVFVVKKTNSNKLGIVYVKVNDIGQTYYLEQVTSVYGGENLLVNKQMIKTGVGDIPKISGWIEAIETKESITKFLADLDKVRKVYAQSVNSLYSVNNILDFEENVNDKNFSEATIGDYDTNKAGNDDNIRYSIGGQKSKTADYSKLSEAIIMSHSGKGSEAVRKATGWYKGKDGKWRYYIPDNKLNIDKLIEIAKTSGKTVLLGDCVEHKMLFDAYPELKNIKVEFKDLEPNTTGIYSPKRDKIELNNKYIGNTELLKDTLIHEIQHAIQKIEDFAEGGNKQRGYAYAVNLAYEIAHNSEQFKKLTTKEERLDYLHSIAQKLFNAKSIKEMVYKAYLDIYGEVESRQVARYRRFDENMLKLVEPNTTSTIIDFVDEKNKFIENLTYIGYNKTEAKKILKRAGDGIDQSGSVEDLLRNDKQVLQAIQDNDRGTVQTIPKELPQRGTFGVSDNKMGIEGNRGSNKRIESTDKENEGSSGDLGRTVRDRISNRPRTVLGRPVFYNRGISEEFKTVYKVGESNDQSGSVERTLRGDKLNSQGARGNDRGSVGRETAEMELRNIRRNRIRISGNRRSYKGIEGTYKENEGSSGDLGRTVRNSVSGRLLSSSGLHSAERIGEINDQSVEHNLIEFGKALGVKIVVEDLRNITLKDKTVSPEGFIDDNGVIHINRYAKAPITFVLKHELTHFCERSKKYKDFVKQVENSKLYKNWLSNKTGEKYLWDAEAAYKQQTLDAHPEIQAITDTETQSARLQAELIADFVGDLLFTDNGSGAVALIAEVPAKQRSKIIQFFIDFVSYLKKKLNGNHEITLRLSALEDSFNRLLSDASNSKYENISTDGTRYSLIIRKTNDNYIKVDAENVTDEEIYNHLASAKSGEYHRNSYIPIRKNTPQALIDTLSKYGININNRAMIMQVRKLQQALSVREFIGKKKKVGDNTRSHKLTIENILSIANNLDNPQQIILQTNRFDRNGNEKPDNVVVVVNIDSTENVAVVEFECSLDKDLTDDNSPYHTVVTMFTPDTERQGFEYDYIEELLSNEDNIELEIENTPNDVATSETVATTSNEVFSNNILSNSDKDVNDKNIQYSMSVDTTKSGRVLTNVEVDNLIKFGKALGVKIVVEDLRNITIADKIVSPDGYIDKDTGTIYISRYAKAPVTFVLKHELSHYCENNFEYAAFAKQVENSKLYKNWLSNKTGEKYLWDAEAAYKQQTLDSHPEIQKLTDPDIKNTRLQTEIIADFVGDLLFTDNGTGMAALIADTPKQYKSKIVQFINDFISYLKKKLSGNREITLRLSVLEDSFNRLLSDMTDTKYNGVYKTGSSDESVFSSQKENKIIPDNVSYCFIPCTDEVVIAKAEQMEKDDAQRPYIWRDLSLMRDAYGNWMKELNTNRIAFYPSGRAALDKVYSNNPVVIKDDYAKGSLANFFQFKQLFKDNTFDKIKTYNVVIEYSKENFGKVTLDYPTRTFYIDKTLYDRHAKNGDIEIKVQLMREIQKAIFKIAGLEDKKYDSNYLLRDDDWKAFSRRLGRYLTVEERYASMPYNYLVNLAEARYRFRQDYVQKKHRPSYNYQNIEANAPRFDFDEIFLFDKYNRFVSARENDRLTLKHKFDVYPQNKYYNKKGVEITEEAYLKQQELERKAKEEAKKRHETRRNETDEQIVDEIYNSNAVGEVKSKINTQKIKELLPDIIFGEAYKFRINPKINAGNSGFFEKGISDEKIMVSEISAACERELSGYDTANRAIDSKTQKEFGDCVFKDTDGNLMSFYLHMGQQKAFNTTINKQVEFETLNSCIERFIKHKRRKTSILNGVFVECYINSVNPYVINLDFLNYSEILKKLYADGKVSEEFKEKTRLQFERTADISGGKAANAVKEKLKILGYDSIVLCKKSGKSSIMVLDSEIVKPVAYNGHLDGDKHSVSDTDYQADELIANIDIIPQAHSAKNLDLYMGELSEIKNNTEKLKRFAEILSSSATVRKKHTVGEKRLVGSSGFFEKGANIWRNGFLRLVQSFKKSKQTAINNIDTVGRTVPDLLKSLQYNNILKDSDGKPLSLFLFNNHEEKRLKHSEIGLHLGTYDMVEQKYIAANKLHPESARNNIEEYYVAVKKPFYIGFEPNGFLPREISQILCENGIIAQYEHNRFLRNKKVDLNSGTCFTAHHIEKWLNRSGYDSLVYLNQKDDIGSLTLIVFDEKQLLPVSINGLPIEDYDKNFAESFDPAFLLPQEDSYNNLSNDVENERKVTVDDLEEKGYNEENIIVDGSHIENGKLKPNIKYKCGEYDYCYQTDSLSRVVKVYVEKLFFTKRTKRNRHNTKTPEKQKGDHAGHLIGDRFGGSAELDNLVSQSAIVNLSEYKKLENKWAKAIKHGKVVTVDITVVYDGDSKRPSGFDVSYNIADENYIKFIKN